MPNPLKDLREALTALGTCPDCALTRFVMATSWRGHGTGRHGTSQYEATSFEHVSPETHCVCVGGPVWAQVKMTEFGRSLGMSKCEAVWRRLPDEKRIGNVVLQDPNDKHSGC
jgi:hypothetical protein